MILTPYDYQESCLGSLRKVRRQKQNRALVVMASGCGKTATVGFDVRDFLARRSSSRVMYLCHQNGILKQARGTLQEVIGGDLARYGYYHGMAKEKESQFLFASFQTMRDHYHGFKRDAFDYIVVDESHHTHASTYRAVVEHFKPQFLLGVTATPNRHDLQDIRTIFGREAFSLNLPEALARGYLTPVDYRLILDELAEIGEIENPYRLSLKELNRRIFVPKRDEEIVRLIHEKSADIKNPHIMTFCNSIRHAERFHSHFESSLPVHSGLHSDEQEERIELFKNGNINNVITVDKFNEGIDIPEVNVVVFLRSTQSYTIFYQQLGRGLRKVKGKKKVLALDFAGNCERIRLIDTLNREVEREREKIAKASEGGGGVTGATVVDFGRFKFTETAKDILAILQKCENGYSEEVLIAQLQNEAERLGRTPMMADIVVSCKIGRTASHETFSQYFGSWNEALTAAGLEINAVSEYDNATLITQLQSEAKRLKRTPKVHDINVASKAGRTASPTVFARAFGSWNKAIKAAGLRLNRQSGLSRKSLIAHLQSEFKRLGRVPTAQDVKMPGYGTFVKKFGSWLNALEAAGLRSKRIQKNRKSLIAQLQGEAKRLKRTPKQTDMALASKGGRTASIVAFKAAFGSWNKALQTAGLGVNFVVKEDKKALIAQLKAEAKRLKRNPGQRDINISSKAKRTAGFRMFKSVFGSWNAALEAAGLKVTVIPSYDKPTLIAQLQAEAKRLKRVPSTEDIKITSKIRQTASVATFSKAFGSWNKALKVAGLASRGKNKQH